MISIIMYEPINVLEWKKILKKKPIIKDIIMVDHVEPSIAEQAVEATVKTIASPDPLTIIEDVKTLLSLVEEFKAKVKDHPTLSDIFKALF